MTTTYFYLVDYTDEVMPCSPRLEAWAEWLSNPAPLWNRPHAARDGDEFCASTLVSHGQITVDRPDAGRADTADGWRITGLVEDSVGQFFLAVPGGWDADHAGPSVDAALEGLEDDPGPHRLECVTAGEDVVLVSLLQLAEVAWTRRAQRMSREQAVIGGVVLVALGSTVLAALGAAAILSGNSWLLVCGVWLLAGALLNACAASGTSPAIFWATAAPTFAGTLAVVLAAARAGAPAAMLCALTLSATLLFVAALAVRGVALRALQSARAASASKGAFLAQVSHEIRTPLNGVLGMAQIMSSGELSDEQRERLEVINRSGRALLSLLNDVLDISKIEAGKLTFDVRPFDLEQLALDLALAFDAAAGPGVGVCADLDAAIAGRWLGDETRTRQILTNLLSNAVKFTKAGEIRLTARVLDGGVELAVSDSGIGIPADRLESIFDSYEQASASTAREFGGTGLGLAISRELAMLMGGRIWATSVLGIGSTFRLWLPLPFEADPLEEPAPPSSTVVDFESLRVLVAEDHPVNQEVIRLMLEPLGIKPIIAGDGRAAVEAWRQADWDLVLMDIQMPVMDGLEAVALIRAEEARAGRPPTPVIALTANAMSHQIEEYVAAGMSGCVAKPLEFALLVEAMSAALGGASAAAGKHVHEAGPVGG